MVGSNIRISIHLMLLFNGREPRAPRSGREISIHLMLLFNVAVALMMVDRTNFNTSNVTIQLKRFYCKFAHIHISIHLMLLFNSGIFFPSRFFSPISIHLMLLFNAAISGDAFQGILFQYI